MFFPSYSVVMWYSFVPMHPWQFCSSDAAKFWFSRSGTCSVLPFSLFPLFVAPGCPRDWSLGYGGHQGSQDGDANFHPVAAGVWEMGWGRESGGRAREREGGRETTREGGGAGGRESFASFPTDRRVRGDHPAETKKKRVNIKRL